MTKPPDEDEADLTAPEGVVLSARNGDVIRYEPSGLTLRLSDRVVADLALRLPPATPTERPPVAPPEGLDAWDARRIGEWTCFTARLPGRQGVRGFRQRNDGGALLAETAGPILGLLGIGGARAALANPGASDFPYHVVAPADDIGAVGHAGVDRAQQTARLEHLRETTHEALVAEVILDWRLDDFGPLPLFVVRVETDDSATSRALATGTAVQNLLVAAANLRAAGADYGNGSKVLAVTLDFALEDHSPDAASYRAGMMAVMDAVSDGLWALGFSRPLFVQRLEGGLPECAPDAALDGQWALAWDHGDHRLLTSAPAYMFALDGYDRPTEAARRQQAEMTAWALATPDDWLCPRLHLAEWDGAALRVTLRAGGPLVIDPDDPFGAGDSAGFSLRENGDPPQITGLRVAEDDPQAVLIQLDRAPGPGARLCYARGTAGALREGGWTRPSATGAALFRWALPASLPITGTL